MKEKIPMTKEECQKLNKKLDYLIIKQSELAKTCGGRGIPLSLLRDIRKLRLMLANPIIIESTEDVVDKGDKSVVVGINDKVTVLLNDGEREEITLVQYDGNSLKKLISAETNYGRSLLGLKVGQRGSYKNQVDGMETFQVLEIEKASKEKEEEAGKKL